MTYNRFFYMQQKTTTNQRYDLFPFFFLIELRVRQHKREIHDIEKKDRCPKVSTDQVNRLSFLANQLKYSILQQISPNQPNNKFHNLAGSQDLLSFIKMNSEIREIIFLRKLERDYQEESVFGNKHIFQFLIRKKRQIQFLLTNGSQYRCENLADSEVDAPF